jgi:hypothetical protein
VGHEGNAGIFPKIVGQDFVQRRRRGMMAHSGVGDAFLQFLCFSCGDESDTICFHALARKECKPIHLLLSWRLMAMETSGDIDVLMGRRSCHGR